MLDHNIKAAIAAFGVLFGLAFLLFYIVITISHDQTIQIEKLENQTRIQNSYINALVNATVSSQNFDKQVITWHDSVEQRLDILNKTQGGKK